MCSICSLYILIRAANENWAPAIFLVDYDAVFSLPVSLSLALSVYIRFYRERKIGVQFNFFPRFFPVYLVNFVNDLSANRENVPKWI